MFDSAGIGKGRGPTVSVTIQGPWNSFATTGPVSTDEFAGGARFHSAGSGFSSVNRLSLFGIPRGVHTLPDPISLQTGFTFGLGLSTVAGSLTLGFTGPFTGP